MNYGYPKIGNNSKMAPIGTYIIFCDLRISLRVNITIVHENTVCATSAFSICMLRVVFNVVLFRFLNDVASCRILLCLLLHN